MTLAKIHLAYNSFLFLAVLLRQVLLNKHFLWEEVAHVMFSFG